MHASAALVAFLSVATSAIPATSAKSVLDIPPSAFKAYELPSSFSGPCDVATGPDNLIYVQDFFANKITRFNQHTEEFTDFDIPFTVPALPNVTLPLKGDVKFFLLSCAIRTGYDGHLYFSNGLHSQLVRHNVTTGEVKVFSPPGLLHQALSNLEPLNDLTTTPYGVYFSATTGNVLMRFDYATLEFTSYPLPGLLSVPLGMYYAKDDGVWFLELVGRKVGRFDPHTHQIQQFPLPPGVITPVVMRAETDEPDGSTTLWFACAASSAIVGINTHTKAFRVYREKPYSLVVEVAQDLRDNVWATNILQNSLDVLNPWSGRVHTVVEPGTLNLPLISLPVTGGSGIFGKGVGLPPGQGRQDAAGDAIWYTRFLANKLVRLNLTNVHVP